MHIKQKILLFMLSHLLKNMIPFIAHIILAERKLFVLIFCIVTLLFIAFGKEIVTIACPRLVSQLVWWACCQVMDPLPALL